MPKGAGMARRAASAVVGGVGVCGGMRGGRDGRAQRSWADKPGQRCLRSVLFRYVGRRIGRGSRSRCLGLRCGRACRLLAFRTARLGRCVIQAGATGQLGSVWRVFSDHHLGRGKLSRSLAAASERGGDAADDRRADEPTPALSKQDAVFFRKNENTLTGRGGSCCGSGMQVPAAHGSPDPVGVVLCRRLLRDQVA